MKIWISVLLLLLVACIAAFAWHADPGYVLIKFGDTSIETTLIFAVIALLLFWGALSLLWRLLRWPLTAWSRRTHRRSRERIASGLVALTEGRYQHALHELDRAAHTSELRAPALLAAAHAAHAHGESRRADAALDRASESAAAAALTLRARFLLEQGKANAALILLKPVAEHGKLPPMGWRMLIEADLLCGDRQLALNALLMLARTQMLPLSTFAALEARVLTAVLMAAPHADGLNALWSGLSRTQRRVPEALAAYAKRATALGQALSGVSELEAALRRDWSERLIRTYGELGAAEADTRLRNAEAWLAAHPNSVGLLLTLGRLCCERGLWGKAQEYLERALAIEQSSALWECLGNCYAGQDDIANAERSYRNALRVGRGESAEDLPVALLRSGLDTRASIVEERSEHGVPRLPLESTASHH